VTVAVVGEQFEVGVVEVALPEAQHRQVDHGFCALFDQLAQFVAGGAAAVEVAVGGEDHAVDAARNEALLRALVGEVEAGGAVGAAAGLERVDGVLDGAAARHGRGRKRDSGAPRVSDDGDAVARFELIEQQEERALDERELVGVAHGARRVDQEDEVRVGADRAWHALAGDGDAHEAVERRPGCGGDVDVDGHRVSTGGRGIGVFERVDQLLDADGGSGRALTELLEVAAHVGVRGGVDVDGEGRERDVFRIEKAGRVAR